MIGSKPLKHAQIVVSGGGLAGLLAASAFGHAGFDVSCIEPRPVVRRETDPGADLRSTAVLQPARALLEDVGLWDDLAAYAAPLETMRIVDLAKTPALQRDFQSSDISEQPFGWNVPNWRLRDILMSRLEAMPNVCFYNECSVTAYHARSIAARLDLSNGTRIETPLVIAADGRNSFLRNAANIKITRRVFGQKALAFAVYHAEPHQNVSTEIHLTGGPFTFVPLQDREGRSASAIVWMDDAKEIDRAAAVDVAEFEQLITQRSGGQMGQLTLASERSVWPIISQYAHRLSAQRMALIAEAAHVVPPIGAQGLNMSIADIAALLKLATTRHGALGDERMLREYERSRLMDIRLRVEAVSSLNRMSQGRFAPIPALRAQLLAPLHDIPPLRRALMHAGLGLRTP